MREKCKETSLPKKTASLNAYVPAMSVPEGWLTHYSTCDLDYHVNIAARACINTSHPDEEVPGDPPLSIRGRSLLDPCSP